MTAPARKMPATEPSEPDEQDTIIADASAMRAWCRARGHTLRGFDERVHEPVAADLLGYSSETLRGWRQSGDGPKHVRVRGRISYRLADLAEWLAAERAAEGDKT